MSCTSGCVNNDDTHYYKRVQEINDMRKKEAERIEQEKAKAVQNAEDNEPRISINFKNVDLKTFLDVISKILKNDIVIVAGGVEPVNLTFKAQNVKLSDVWDFLEQNNVLIEKADFGWRAYPNQFLMRTYQVDGHILERSGNASISVTAAKLSDNGSNSADVKNKFSNNFWESIEKNIGVILGMQNANTSNNKIQTDERASFTINREAGIVVVNALPKQHYQVRSVVDTINESLSYQVVIEARILDVTYKDELNSGLKAVMKDGNGLTFGLNPRMSGTNLGSVASQGINTIFGFSLKGANIDAALDLLSQVSKFSTIASPHIIVGNGHEAIVKVGDDEYFLTVVSSTLQNANGNNADGANQNTGSAVSESLRFERFFNGIALCVVPKIIDGGKSVTLYLHPTINRVMSEQRKMTISGKETSFTIPKVTTREADTVVTAHDGDIIIIGGLSNDLSTTGSSGPFRSRNKLLQWLFGENSNSVERNEILIIIQIKIVKM